MTCTSRKVVKKCVHNYRCRCEWKQYYQNTEKKTAVQISGNDGYLLLKVYFKLLKSLYLVFILSFGSSETLFKSQSSFSFLPLN